MNNSNRSHRIFNLTLAITIVLAFLLGFQLSGLVRLLSRENRLPGWVTRTASMLSYDVQASPDGFKESDLENFYEVLAYISQTYLNREEMNVEDVIHGASAGAVAALGDNYSRFVPLQDQQVLTEEIEGSYAGIGVSIIDRPGMLPPMVLDCEIATGIDPQDVNYLRESRGVAIVQVFETGPAYASGIQSDDVVVCVDGQSLRGAGADEAANLIKGPEGTDVEITFWRPALQKEITFTITRQSVHVPTVSPVEMLSDEIGYIRLNSFNNLTPVDVAEAVNNLLAQGMKGLIFDLRNNPGGVMDAAAAVADIFISDGNLVSYEDSQGNRVVFASQDDGDAIGIPLILLVNGYSASSSEIVAGAVQDTHVGLLVGENTFGKGVVQNVYTLRDGSGLVLTTGRYLTPNEREITQDGITPDIVTNLDTEVLRQESPEIDAFLSRMEDLTTQFTELQQQMYDYLRLHDFQRETAIDIMGQWLDTGRMPVDWESKTATPASELKNGEAASQMDNEPVVNGDTNE